MGTVINTSTENSLRNFLHIFFDLKQFLALPLEN